jgi:cell division protein FtsL
MIYSGKKGEMTMEKMVGLILAVVIILILIYMVMKPARNASIAGSCEEKFCSVKSQAGENCEKLDGYTKSLTSCKVGEETGKCCIREDFG